MICRRMAKEDIPYVAQLEAASFSEPWSAESFKQDIDSKDYIFLVVTEGSQIIGYLGAQCVLDDANITTIAVSLAYRGRGVAKVMFNEAFSNFVARGIINVNLEVRVSNSAAISLYEKLGFVTLGTRKRFYRFPTEDAVIMTKRL